MRKRISCFLLCLVMTQLGCNRAKELNPQSDNVPKKAFQAVKKQFPESTSLVFAPLTPEKIWSVDFESNARQYKAVVDTQAVLANARFLSNQLPGPLAQFLDKLAIRGGTIASETWEIQPDPVAGEDWPRVAFDYQWKGMERTIKVITNGANNVKFALNMGTQSSLAYYVDKPVDVSPKIGSYLKRMGLVEPSGMWVSYARDGRRTFINKNGTYIFDQNENPVYVLHGSVIKQEDLPAFVFNYINASPEMDGFVFETAIRFSAEGSSGYQISIRKDTEIGQIFYLYFNDNGDLIYHDYTAYQF
ncbi:hypothetical protein MUK70_04225 [Dyadobacter chenwenxiniae]|uniref:Beta-lactamase-inhibitor-like, PepSY-like n=1 Tax=Dyadobacter chenwenxiniae TaxID=2906456 RepID=A0A9X1PNQ1_9BACT|nr:hypothetical protein [Dyadobacter chenwenxiniae]MCF0064747.1 hypothetical protein [Dyadobacter chenwenxiniae]UON84199.1 hypothetical protein MUK70_04225 [Dyadobacter chenwenxiniae]